MNTAEAITEVKRFGRFIKAFQHLDEVAEHLGAADQLIAERTAELLEVDAKIERAGESLQAAQEAQLTQQEALTDAATAAQVERSELLAVARAEAEQILVDARTELDALTEGNHEAALNQREIRSNIASSQLQLDELLPKLADAREKARQIMEGAA